MDGSKHRKTCIIVGAGVSGLVQAAELIRQGVLKSDQISILERAHDYGGVWTAATYPGAACDVFSILYQISWFKNPKWSGLFPTSHELVEYYNSFADHYGLRQGTVFGHRVIEASWSEKEGLWDVLGEDLSTGQRINWQCDILVQAAGTYNRKKVPTVDGIEEFRGDIWHTVDWPQDYDFSGKRVAYIGTGPTALQALPVVRAQAEHLTIFMRSITYCHPFSNYLYPSWLLWIFQNVPTSLWLYATVVSYGFGLWTWFVFRPGTWLARAEERYCKRYLHNTVSDADLRQKLQPTGRFGSKRPLVSPNFFNLVQESNVELVQESLIRVCEDGIISTASSADLATSKLLAEGEDVLEEVGRMTRRKFDTIIWGTGFKMQGWGSMIPTRGLQGKLLSESWGTSPKTLFGTMTSEFPNLFINNGPNTVAPWTSIIQGIEYQAAIVARLAAWIMERRNSGVVPDFWIAPSPEAEAKWTAEMQEPLDRLATSTKFGPGFYYLNERGQNTFFFPFTLWYYWWRTRSVQKGLYTTSSCEDLDS